MGRGMDGKKIGKGKGIRGEGVGIEVGVGGRSVMDGRKSEEGEGVMMEGRVWMGKGTKMEDGKKELVGY